MTAPEALNPDDLITTEETENLIMAALRGAEHQGHHDGVTEPELKRCVDTFLDRLIDARITLAMLQLMTEKKLAMWLNDSGELIWSNH